MFPVVHVCWALRVLTAKPILMTVKTMTVRMGQLASMESPTTLVFVLPITQVL